MGRPRLTGIDGLEVGDEVTGEQMRLLFAEGRHPLAGATSGDAGELAQALGPPYRQGGREQPFLAALRDRFAAQLVGEAVRVADSDPITLPT